MDELTPNLASRWKRLGGGLIDSLLSMIIMGPIMLATGVLQMALRGEAMSIGQQAVLFAAGWLVFLALNGYLLMNRGQTIGKLVLRTRIVDLSGNVPNFGKLLILRYLIVGLAGQIPILGSIAVIVNALFIFGKERRCLHDYMAGTRVIEA